MNALRSRSRFKNPEAAFAEDLRRLQSSNPSPEQQAYAVEALIDWQAFDDLPKAEAVGKYLNTEELKDDELLGLGDISCGPPTLAALGRRIIDEIEGRRDKLVESGLLGQTLLRRVAIYRWVYSLVSNTQRCSETDAGLPRKVYRDEATLIWKALSGQENLSQIADIPRLATLIASALTNESDLSEAEAEVIKWANDHTTGL